MNSVLMMRQPIQLNTCIHISVLGFRCVSIRIFFKVMPLSKSSVKLAGKLIVAFETVVNWSHGPPRGK